MKSTNLTQWQFSNPEWLEEPPFGYRRVPGWLDASVPGYVHLDLNRHGIIEDPHRAMAELGCAWVDQTSWVYRCTFNWEEDKTLPLRILQFEGLDTVCTIALNGRELAEHQNMFLPLEVDVSTLLDPGENEILVTFKPASLVGFELRERYLKEHGIGPEVLNFDERAFLRKAQYMFGWDWGPRIVSCGIWKPVRFIQSEGVNTSESNMISPPPVQLVQEKDALGESFRFTRDGEPLWIRGANWIPNGSFPSQTANLPSLLQSAKEMGINMLRVWGGGIYESDEFYQLCSQLEILVWQDFPFACSYYPDDPDFLERVREEAIFHVKRLRQYPCLAIWCGNNENLTMWEGKWGGTDRQPPRFHGERIWNEILPAVVAEHDPGRAYIATSPIGSPPGQSNCNADGYGDQHYWDVWHGRGDWIHYSDSKARFSSEFGFPSSCGMSALQKAGLDGSSFADIPFRWHDKTGRPLAYWLELLKLHYPEPRDLEEWVYFTQLNQRDAMRHAVEHYRGGGFCSGTLIWQLNDVWPAQSWSLIDSEGDWKAAAFELQRLYADDLHLLKIEDNRAVVWQVNDGDFSVNWVSLSAIDSITGEILRRVEVDGYDSPYSSRFEVCSLDFAGLKRSRTFLYLTSMSGETTRLLCEPRSLQLDASPLEIRQSGGSLIVSSTAPVVDLYLYTDEDEIVFKENFFSLPGPGSRRTEMEGNPTRILARSLAGRHEVRYSEA